MRYHLHNAWQPAVICAVCALGIGGAIGFGPLAAQIGAYLETLAGPKADWKDH